MHAYKSTSYASHLYFGPRQDDSVLEHEAVLWPTLGILHLNVWERKEEHNWWPHSSGNSSMEERCPKDIMEMTLINI